MLEGKLAADPVRDGGADLHGYAFASGAAAKEVRRPCAAHDERYQAQRDALFASVAHIEHKTHAATGVFAPFLITKDDGKTGECQEGQKECKMCVSK